MVCAWALLYPPVATELLMQPRTAPELVAVLLGGLAWVDMVRWSEEGVR